MAEQDSLGDSWDREAENWVRWARKPGHDSYWRFHRDAFFRLVPPPGRLTLDIGCGEGRRCGRPAVRERYRVAIVHPLNSAGAFAGREHDAGFLLQDYMTVRRYSERVERDGMSLTFHQIHRPLHHYTEALSAAGFVIEAFHEVCVDDASVRMRGDRARWQRVPLFVDLRALKS